MGHKHKWTLVSVKRGNTTYESVGSVSVPTGKNADVATYVCECGEQKTEELKSQWT